MAVDTAKTKRYKRSTLANGSVATDDDGDGAPLTAAVAGGYVG